MIKTLENKLENYCGFLRKPDFSLLSYDTEYSSKKEVLEMLHNKVDFDADLFFVDKSKSELFAKYIFDQEKNRVKEESEIVIVAIFKMENEDLVIFSATESYNLFYDKDFSEFNIFSKVTIPHFIFDKEDINDEESTMFKYRLKSNKEIAKKLESLLV